MRHVVATAAIAVTCLLPAQRAFAHPLHTTLTEMTEDRTHGIVRATIRVFADDFGTSLNRFARTTAVPMTPQWNASAFAYASSVLSIVTRQSVALPLRSCGVTRSADVLWICVEAAAPAGLASVMVRNAMLCDQFEDQINVVQATYGGSRHSILFTRGDRLKPLG
ncbi:hypothetical protein BH11GEM2_BH11GEM2_04250 [soil metagenome]